MWGVNPIKRPLKIKDWVPVILFFGVYMTLGASFGFRDFVSQWLGFPSPRFAEESPMYFVRADLRQGILFAISLVPVVVIYLGGLRVGAQLTPMVLLLAYVMFIPGIVNAGYVIASCSNIMVLGETSCPWTDFYDYKLNPVRLLVQAPIYLALFGWVWKVRRMKRSATIQSPTT